MKLDDPDAAPDGPGHDMSQEELLTEFAHYDDPPADVAGLVTKVSLLDIETATPVSAAAVPDYQRNERVGFLDFRGRPADFNDSQDGEFDEKFPTTVRADDFVKVVATGRVKIRCPCTSPDCKAAELAALLPPFKERFWVHVTSVTIFGMVTGTTGTELQGCPQLNETHYLAFPIAAVLGVNRGENWQPLGTELR